MHEKHTHRVIMVKNNAYAHLYPKLEITIEERNSTFCPVEISFPLMCLYVT